MQHVTTQTSRPTTLPTTRTAIVNRVAYIDNLRVFLTIMVIVLHSAVTYGSEGGWYYKEPTDDMAAIIPLTATAGTPTPGMLESPQQSRPGSGVAGPGKTCPRSAR